MRALKGLVAALSITATLWGCSSTQSPTGVTLPGSTPPANATELKITKVIWSTSGFGCGKVTFAFEGGKSGWPVTVINGWKWSPPAAAYPPAEDASYTLTAAQDGTCPLPGVGTLYLFSTQEAASNFNITKPPTDDKKTVTVAKFDYGT